MSWTRSLLRARPCPSGVIRCARAARGRGERSGSCTGAAGTSPAAARTTRGHPAARAQLPSQRTRRGWRRTAPWSSPATAGEALVKTGTRRTSTPSQNAHRRPTSTAPPTADQHAAAEGADQDLTASDVSVCKPLAAARQRERLDEEHAGQHRRPSDDETSAAAPADHAPDDKRDPGGGTATSDGPTTCSAAGRCCPRSSGHRKSSPIRSRGPGAPKRRRRQWRRS